MTRTYTIIDMTSRHQHTTGSSSSGRRSRFKHYITLILGIAALIIGSLLLAQILLGVILFVGGFFLVMEFIKYTNFKQ